MSTVYIFAFVLFLGIFSFLGVIFILLFVLFGRKKPRSTAKSTPTQPKLQSAPTQVTYQAPVLSRRLPYEKRQQLLTNAERTFAEVLHVATPNTFAVYPQMRLASIVNVAAWGKHNEKNFYRIQAKCVDFVLCDAQTSEPKLVVELDDASHDRADRKARDAFVDDVLASAGIPILHVRWQRTYDGTELSHLIHEKIGPAAAQPPIMPKNSPPAYAAVESPWAKPIAVGAATPQSSGITTALPLLVHEMRVVCAQYQQDVRRDDKFCGGCGAILGL